MLHLYLCIVLTLHRLHCSVSGILYGLMPVAFSDGLHHMSSLGMLPISLSKLPDCSIFGSAVLENQYPGSCLPEICVALNIRPTIDQILAAIWGEHDMTMTMASVRDWVEDRFYVHAMLPLMLIMHVLPQCVVEFRSCKKGQSHIVPCSLLDSSCFLTGKPLEPQAAAAQASLVSSASCSSAVEGV